MFNPGFDVKVNDNPIGFSLGESCFSNGLEIRKLDSIRKSLFDPNCQGPEDVYAIMMDVGKKKDYNDLVNRNLLYGIVCYSKGRLGKEPIRSQGHQHAISRFSSCSTPEVYEIWTGTAIVYMQEFGGDNPGRCFAVIGHPGDVIIVPPYWIHATINADEKTNMSFGAWCVRDYAFEYKDVRSHGGIAWFPVYENNDLVWIRNEKYQNSKLEIKKPNDYSFLGLENNKCIYSQYEDDNSRFDFVVNPMIKEKEWENYIP